jgi:hypothetical protein
VLFLALTGVFYLATLRPGQGWGDDFAMYIIQARNVALGEWNAPTGYVYIPQLGGIGPPRYPPLFPLLLAPLYRAWGLNLTPMKVEVVLIFFGALYLMFEFYARAVGFRYALAIVAVVGLSPWFWQFKENILSDLPFLFFAMLALMVISRCEERKWASTGEAAAAALVTYLCFAVRTAGVVLIPCLALSAIPRRGTVRWKAVGALAGAVALVGAQSLLFSGAGGYLSVLGNPFRGLLHQAMAYSWSLRTAFFGIGSAILGTLFLVSLFALSAAGMIARLRNGVSAVEVFVFFYACMVAVWRIDEDLRFLIPLLPFWFLYICEGLRRLPKRVEWAAASAVAIVIVCGFAWQYARERKGPFIGPFNNPAFENVASYIRSQTPRDAVFVFSKPRALALLTDRSAAAYYQPQQDMELWGLFDSLAVRYVLVNRGFPDDREYLEPLLIRSSRAVEARADGPFHLYAVR